jgi:hypothetical protein
VVDYSPILPLDVFEFNGRIENESMVLNWTATSEVSSDDFMVERSLNGTDYVAIGQVVQDNKPGDHYYSFTDRDVSSCKAKMVYYRIMRNDSYGRHVYSRVISIPLKKKNELQLYPNPAQAELRITLKENRQPRISYKVYDNGGKLQLQGAGQVPDGTGNFSIDVHNLRPGIYYLQIRNDQMSEQLQFVKR